MADNISALSKKSFGKDFIWGVSSSAYQTEGFSEGDGRGLCIWDVFLQRKNKSLYGDAKNACGFYTHYRNDLQFLSDLSIPNFRFSLSWPRIFPLGKGTANAKGIDFYNRLIDASLEKQIIPWLTLYHWDLPEELESRGGWTNRDIIYWFAEYVQCCAKHFGDRIRNWMVLNEPAVFTGAGYFLGIHAPGKKGLKNFLPAVHHSLLSLSHAVKVLKLERPESEVGSTFSCSFITPHSHSIRDHYAAVRIDALLNRLFIEPLLGMGYPVKDIPFLERITKYLHAGDEQLLKTDFDFIGLQSYTREVVAHFAFTPYIKAGFIPADKRKVYRTSMNWEVYPPSLYEMIMKFNRYPGVKKIIITENGAAFPDAVEGLRVHDTARADFLEHYLLQVLRAKKDGGKVDGYFVWSFTDNFEWMEGFRPRFGLVYIDFETQQRIVKDSGFWYRDFLRED